MFALALVGELEGAERTALGGSGIQHQRGGGVLLGSVCEEVYNNQLQSEAPMPRTRWPYPHHCVSILECIYLLLR